MTLNTKSTFGNFAIEAEADVSDTQRDALASLGLLQLLQRSPSSAAEKAMAGYEKRPAGFKRDSIPFNDSNRAILERELQKSIAFPKDDDGELLALPIQCAISVAEYVPTTKEPAFAYEKKIWNGKNAKGEASLQKLAELVEYEGDLKDGDAAPEAFLQAIKVWASGV